MRLKYFLWGFLIISSCNEKLNFSYEDSKRSDIAYFFENSDDFHVYHDIDRSIIQGTFKINNLENYNNNVDYLAKRNNWLKVFDKNHIKRFVRKENEINSVCILETSGNIVKIKFFSE